MDSYAGFTAAGESLKNALNEKSSQSLHIALNEINSLKYPAPIPNYLADELLQQLLLLKTTDESIICKVFLLFKNLIARQKVCITPALLSSINLWIIRQIPVQPEDAWNILALTLRGCHDKEVLAAVFGVNPLQFMRKNRVYVIRVIDIMTPGILEHNEDFTEQVFEIATLGLELLQSKEVDLDFAFRVLNIARHIVHFHPDWAEDGKLALLVGCFKAFLTDDAKAPTAIQPAQQTLPDDSPAPKKSATRNVTKMGKRKGKVNVVVRENPIAQTSDSDFSEKEEVDRDQFLVHKRYKLRHTAINLALTLAQTVDKKLLFGYFHTFFSDTNNSLLTSIATDPSPKCRASALQATALFIFKFRPYLLQSELSAVAVTAFTPFVVALGNTMLTLYDQLARILEHEENLNILMQALKCAGTLIGATPLQRTKKQVITPLIAHVERIFKHRDLTVKVACLNVMEAIYSADGMTEEILREIGLLPLVVDEEEEYEAGEEPPASSSVATGSFTDWHFEAVFELLGAASVSPATTNSQLRIQCFQILQVSAPFIRLYVEYLPLMATSINLALGISTNDVNVHAAKALEAITRNLNKVIMETEARHLLNSYYKFWGEVQKSCVQEMENAGGHRSLILDAFINYECIYDRLARHSQLNLISLLNGFCVDEDEMVCGSAVRSLAIYTHFPTLKDDICFVENSLAAILSNVQKPGIGVRLKASWALAHVADIFDEKSLTSINRSIIREVFEKCTQTPKKENEKVKTNLVRCLGTLLKLLTFAPDDFDESMRPLVKDAVNVICADISNAYTMKLKWNACYAAYSFLRNETPVWLPLQVQLFVPLCLEAKKSINFKVKTSAVNALGAPSERYRYGDSFTDIFETLITVLIESNNLNDYNAYKHKEYLHEEICLVISHFLNLVKIDDLHKMEAAISPNVDVLKPIWTRSVNRMVPEKVERICRISHNMEALRSEAVTSEKRRALETIENCFIVQDLF